MNKIISLAQKLKEQKFLEGELEYLDDQIQKHYNTSWLDPNYQILIKREEGIFRRQEKLKISCGNSHIMLEFGIDDNNVNHEGQCLICGSYGYINNRLLIKITSKVDLDMEYPVYMLTRCVFELLLYREAVNEKDLTKIIFKTEKIINSFLRQKSNIDLLYETKLLKEDLAKTLVFQN